MGPSRVKWNDRTVDGEREGAATAATVMAIFEEKYCILLAVWANPKHDKKTTHKSPQSRDKYVQSSGYGNVYTSWVTWGSFCLVNHKINECSSCVFCCIWWCLGTNVPFFFCHSLCANKLSPTTSLSLASIASVESHSLCVKCGFQKSFVRIRLGGHFNGHLHGQ